MGTGRLNGHDAQRPVGNGQGRKQSAQCGQCARYIFGKLAQVGEVDQQLAAFAYAARTKRLWVVQPQVVGRQALALFHVVNGSQPLSVWVHQINREAGCMQQAMHVPLYDIKHLLGVQL